MPVNISAGQFFKQLCTLIRIGLKKCREAALSEQHRLSETLKIQPGQALGFTQFFVDFVSNDFAVGHQCQLNLGRLQCPISFVAGAALAPKRSVRHTFNFKLNLGQALSRVPRHQFIAPRRHRTHTWRAVIQGQANSIKQRGFTRAGGPGNREQPVVFKWLGSEINLPLALE